MSDKITVTIKLTNIKKVPIQIEANSSVLALKEKIETTESIPADTQTLIFGGKILKDETLLQDNKLVEGSILHLVRRSKPETAASGGATTPNSAPVTPPAMTPATTTVNQQQPPPTSLFVDPMAFQGGGAGVSADMSTMIQQLQSNPELMRASMNLLMSNPGLIQSMMDHNMQPDPNSMNSTMSQLMSDPEFMRQMMETVGQLSTTPQQQTMAPQQQWTAAPQPSSTSPQQQWTAAPQQSSTSPQQQAATSPVNQEALAQRFSAELKLLNDMGFWEANANIEALTLTGGNVEAAIEILLRRSN